MCGRYSLFVPPEQLADRFDVTVDTYERTYNAAPSQSLPVIADTDQETLSSMEWGFIPPWANRRSDGGHINARAETLDSKPTFSDALQKNERDGLRTGRCLVPADGFYEWVETANGKQPHRVTVNGGEPFAMAGLWAQWRPETEQTGLDAFATGEQSTDETVRETFTIVTTEPNSVVRELHHRMAVILPESAEQSWLSGDVEAALNLSEPYPATEMRHYEVSPAVNNPANDSPAVAEPIE